MMRPLIVASILLVVQHSEEKIVPAANEPYTFLVSIRNQFNNFVACGTVLSPTLILTAASSVYGRDAKDLLVILGDQQDSFGYQYLPELYFERVLEHFLDESKNRSCGMNNDTSDAEYKIVSMRKILRSVEKIDTSHIRPVSQIILHPAFNLTGRLNFNAAILKLEHSIKVNWIKSPELDLSSSESYTNNLQLVGWGEFNRINRLVRLQNISECAIKVGKNMSNNEYGCLQNTVVSPVQPFCLTGCPVVQETTKKLYGIITTTAKKLTKNNLLLMTNTTKIMPFIHAVVKGVDFEKWKEDIQDLVKEFVKDVVRKSFI